MNLFIENSSGLLQFNNENKNFYCLNKIYVYWNK